MYKEWRLLSLKVQESGKLKNIASASVWLKSVLAAEVQGYDGATQRKCMNNLFLFL